MAHEVMASWLQRLKHYRLFKWLIFLLLLPYILTLFYLVIPAPSTLMLYDLAILRLPKRDWVSIEHISPNVIRAVLTAEDSAFCTHHGFDFKQLGKSVEKAMDYDAPIRATSTISQQTAKNLFLWHGRSWLRKILEIPLTAYIEIVLPKKRILELYLNIAEWGDGIYGIEAASQHYFGTSAKYLSAYQATLLAAALPNPLERRANNPSGYYLNYALNLQRRLGNSAADSSCVK